MQILSALDLQRQTLRLYGEMVVAQANWAGRLVFTCGSGATATGLPAAVSIAGGTTLALDPNAASVKAVFRQGGIDFVVNSLDEALRVLKNEIRKKRPLSVALLTETQPVIDEMLERGVMPDLLVEQEGEAEAESFVGVPKLRFGNSESSQLVTWLTERSFFETTLSAASSSEMREIDARLLSILPEEDRVRRAWVQRIGHYQRGLGGGQRVVWLAENERSGLGLPGA
jgi:urocanate hydratase